MINFYIQIIKSIFPVAVVLAICSGCVSPENVTPDKHGMFGMAMGRFRPPIPMFGCPYVKQYDSDVFDDGSGYEYVVWYMRTPDDQKKFYKIQFEEYNHPCHISIDKMKEILNEVHEKLESYGYQCDRFNSEGFASGLVKALARVKNHDWITIRTREKKGAGRNFLEAMDGGMKATGRKGLTKEKYVPSREIKENMMWCILRVCCVIKGNCYTKIWQKTNNHINSEFIKNNEKPKIEIAEQTAIRFWFARPGTPAESIYIDIPIN